MYSIHIGDSLIYVSLNIERMKENFYQDIEKQRQVMRQKIEKQNKRILEFEKMKQGLYLKHHSKEELESLWELVQK